MSEWAELTNYTYDPSADVGSQHLYVQSVCQPFSAQLFILGYETHTVGGSPVTDYEYSVYQYNAATGVLTLISDDPLAVLSGQTFGPNDSNVPTLTSFYLDQMQIGTDGTNPILLLNTLLTTDPASGNYESPILINVSSDSIIYESYSSGEYTMLDYGSSYSIYPRRFDFVTYNFNTYILLDEMVAFPESLVGGPKLEIGLAPPATVTSTAPLHMIGRVTSTGVTYIDDEVEASTTVSSGSNVKFNPRRTYTIILDNNVKYLYGSILYTYIKSLQIGGAWPYTYDVTRTLQDIQGISYGGDNHVGDIDTLTDYLYQLTCPSETFWAWGFYKPRGGGNVSKIGLDTRTSSEIYINDSSSSNCSVPEWTEVDPFPGDTTTYRGSAYLKNTSTILSMFTTTYPDSSTGLLTAQSPVGGALDIEKNALTISPEEAFYLHRNFYVLSGTKLYWVLAPGNLEAEPTSITSLPDNIIFIGGSTLTPIAFSGGTFTPSGITSEEVISNFINTALVAGLELPDMPSSGLYRANPVLYSLGISGVGYVKRYDFETVFAHGNLSPNNPVILGMTYYQDYTYNLASGTNITSVAFSTDEYITTISGGIFSISPSGNSWEEYSQTAGIKTSQITSESELYVSTPTGENSLIKTSLFFTPTWEAADGGLPNGVTVLDIEEEYYEDR